MTSPDRRRRLPRTDTVLGDARLVAAAARLGRGRVRRAVTEVLDGLRAEGAPAVPEADAVAEAALRRLPDAPSSLRPVLNATGVVIHTNLGRAPLSPAAVDAVVAAAGYVDVEFDLATGQRARRGRGAAAALRAAVPDAEDVHVTNNGAAALLLAVATVAAGREVLVARGELIEIGDGFRLPELIEAAGARIREVGTTNRTSLDDYASALDGDVAAVVKLHPSNFRVEGFTRSVEVGDLAPLGRPVIADLGSGLLAPSPILPAEPDVRSTLHAGAAVVTCSGDKLLGGPQAGLIFGREELVAAMRRHPFARAVRVDKLTLAALEATVDGPRTPTHLALHVDADKLRRRCEDLAAGLSATVACEVVASDGVVGGGGAPGVALPGWALALPEPYAAALRSAARPVLGRVERGRCLLDLRCVPPAEDAVVLAAIQAVAAER